MPLDLLMQSDRCGAQFQIYRFFLIFFADLAEQHQSALMTKVYFVAPHILLYILYTIIKKCRYKLISMSSLKNMASIETPFRN